MKIRPHLAVLIGILLASCSSSTTAVSPPGASLPPTAAPTLAEVIPQPTQDDAIQVEAQETPEQAAVSQVQETHEQAPESQAQETSPPATPLLQPSPRPTLAADDWMSLPIIPTVSDSARRIYQLGQTLGRDPHAFSKVGDCQVSTDFFLVSFDLSEADYQLGEYAYLQETIDWFAGSFARSSRSSRDAMRAESLFSALYADPSTCQPGEGPLACEYRLHNPSIAIISMEQTWTPYIDLEQYTRYMRQAVEYTISQGIVPILATKADNLEGNHQINRIIAQLAWEYDIPLWNFWAAVQPLPNHGLLARTPSGKADNFHLSAGRYYDLSLPITQHTGWTMRNLTALQSLDAVWKGLTED